MQIDTRKIKKEDNVALSVLIKQVFEEFSITHYPGSVYHDPTTNSLYEFFQAEEKSVYLVAEENNVILGGCGIYPTPGLPDGCAELVKFYLSPQSRGKGIGKMLMEKCLAEASVLGYNQIYLESFPELAAAVKLYEKHGFSFIPNALGNSGHYSCTIWMIKNI